MAAAAQEEMLDFYDMTEAELRQWVEANPRRVNDRDSEGLTPLAAIALKMKGLPLLMWLLDEKGADVNVALVLGTSALHEAASLDIFNALMDHEADPTRVEFLGRSILMRQVGDRAASQVARLLQDPRVRATINMQDVDGNTALRHACFKYGVTDAKAASKVHFLFQAGANPTIANNNGEAPLAYIRQHRPSLHVAIALLEQSLAEAEKATLLVKARRLAVATTINTVVPSYLQARMDQGQLLPCVALVPLTDGQSDGEEGRKLRTTLAFLCGVGREGMPRDVFRVVMDLLMPSWDPLRRKNAGTAPPAVQG